MKKILIFTISLLLLTGCSVINTEYKNTQEQIIEEVTGRKFEFSNAICLRDKAKVQFRELNRNDEITIIDEDDDFYYFDNNGLTLAIEKDYVRTQNDEPFEEYVGYTYSYSELFSDYGLKDLIHNFEKNDEVKVIDKVKKVLLVEYEGQFGYMYPSDVSDTYIVTRTYKPAQTQTSGGGGGGGGYTPPAPVNPDPPASSGDAEEIETSDLLAFVRNDNQTEYVPNDSFESIQGKVLLDDTIAYITYCSRSEDVRVLDYDEESATLLISGFVGKIKKEYLRLEGEEEYEAWDGYAYGGAEIFYDYELTDEMDWFYKNDDIHVIDRIGDIYVVQLTDGSYGYMSVDDVSETYLPTYKPAPAPTPAPSGGGGGYTPPAQDPTPAPAEESRIIL